MNQPKHRLLGIGFALCALLGPGGAARAQYAFDEDDAIMPPRAVVWRLADRGFSGVGRPRFDGRAYVVEAFAPNGARVRLFVDAVDGSILGRQRLDAPSVASARPMPGYGWTEEDEAPRRPMRQAERMVPPVDIPAPESRGVPPRRGFQPEAGPGRPDGATGLPTRAGIEPNANGLNPDARPRPDAPRKVARVGQPALKPVESRTARTAPEAPKLKAPELGRNETDTGEVAKGGVKPDARPEAPVAAIEPSQPAAAVPSTPAAVQPPADGTVAAKPAEAAPATKPVAQAWKDPPEGRRPVRVIGGATMVPGQAETKPEGTP